MLARLSCSQEKKCCLFKVFKGVTFPANRFVTVNMFESEESDSSVLRKSMSEADEWKKEEVDVEEVV